MNDRIIHLFICLFIHLIVHLFIYFAFSRRIICTVWESFTAIWNHSIWWWMKIWDVKLVILAWQWWKRQMLTWAVMTLRYSLLVWILLCFFVFVFVLHLFDVLLFSSFRFNFIKKWVWKKKSNWKSKKGNEKMDV